LGAAGATVYGTGRTTRSQQSEYERPETIEDTAELVLQRVDTLDSGSRRLLGVAAVVGSRFSPALVADVCGVDARLLADVLADAVRHGLVERRDDGNVAFLHDRIREALLRGAGDRQALHDRIADALARRTDSGPQHVYALAHHRASGHPGHDPAGRFDACRRAGALALDDHAPESALFYLQIAAAAAESAGIVTDAGFGELLGVAYHEAYRFDEAVDTLRRTLELVGEPVRRAHLLYLIANVEETRWNSAGQVAANAQALDELGRALPRNPVLRALSTLWFFIVGCVIGVTGIGFGTRSAAKRERYRLMCLLYESSGAAEIRMLNPLGSLIYALRSPYVANRAGRTPEMARLYSSVGYVARVIGLHRLADRLIAVATRTAEELGDRVASSYVAWHAAVANYSSGRDAGESVRRMLDEHQRWLDVGLYLDGCALLCWDGLMYGDMAEMEPFFARRTARAVAGGQVTRSSVVSTDAVLLALRGRPSEAAERLAGLAGTAQAHQRIDRLIAMFATAMEQAEPGTEFADAAREFDATGLGPRDLLAVQHAIYVFRAYGELTRCRRADDAEQDSLLAAARKTIAALAGVPQRPILRAHHQILTAALLEVSGDPAAALAALAKAEPALRAADGPLPAYETAVVRARAYRALGVTAAALREARTAAAIADEQGWAHRSRRITAEFGTTLSGGRTRHGDGMTISGARHGQRWAALKQVSLAASRVLDPVKLARIALDETIRILGAERAFLLLLDPATGELVPQVGRDAGGADLGELTGYSASLVDRVRADRQALVVTGSEEGEALGSQSMLVYGLRSILVAPLQLDDRLLGVVYLDSRVAKGVFTGDDVDILTAVTHHVAVALETARTAQLELTVEAATRQRDVAEALRQAMTWLAGTLQPDEVLQRLLTTVTRTRGGERAWLVLGEPAATTVSVLDGDGLTETPVTDAGPAVVDLLGLADATVYPASPAWSTLLTEGLNAAGCWLAVPLRARDESIGVLVLAAPRDDAYRQADVEVVAALAGQGMVAYENARLFSQVHHLATVDSLTGIANRRSFFETGGRQLASARHDGTALAAVMLDIDHFKKINDTYGHQVGDDVIRGVVARLRAQSREADLLGRYGGEEFVILLPDIADG
ncbi:MAG: diguanylate cyclase, partial [Actinoplanes sp.]